MTSKTKISVLIESWFPYKEVGIECRRERGMSSALPPINFLHVWWARRPLTVCKAAILGSILPADFDREEFNKLMKFEENLVRKYQYVIDMKRKGIRGSKGYEKERVFKVNLTSEEKKIIKQKNVFKESVSLLDPMSGGGSIPFEAVRIGMETYASDLNPVACLINYAGIVYPLRYGKELAKKVQYYGKKIVKNVKERVKKYYHSESQQLHPQFLWVRTVNCPNPDCELEVPLSPNWDLSQNPRIILKIVTPEKSGKVCKFKIIENPSKEEQEKRKGTVKGGAGVCPRCNTTLSSEHIKSEAQEWRMGHQLMAIVYKEPVGPKKTIRRFRVPNEKDMKAIIKVEEEIKSKKEEWRKKGIFIEETIRKGLKTNEMLNKGINDWYQMFNNRQLLINMIILEEIITLKKQLMSNQNLDKQEVKAIITYLQFALDKTIDRNSIQTRWVSSYQRIANTFDRHDFAFKWSYAEMAMMERGYDWAIKNVLKAYEGLVNLLGSAKSEIEISRKKAQKLDNIDEKTVDVIVVDPPYYDNVMYAELSDFFYVWMKKGIGDLYPELFSSEAADKDNEAVANPSRFDGMGKSKKQLAKQDYEAKMRASFSEMHRVLKDEGVLTIMFTHKATDAWDTLAMSLMEAGFEITASWPVHTESEISLHIAKKNAVKSTILLVCRKREASVEDVWWEEDVLPAIKNSVKQKAEEFQKQGINGTDLFIACFGQALREYGRYFPVKNIEGEVVRPEEALIVAREIVIDLRFKEIFQGNVDVVSKFYLLIWYFYKARRIPFDEARQLALAVGVNLEELKGNFQIIQKISSDIELLSAFERKKKGILNTEKVSDDGVLINAVHLAILAYHEGGKKKYETVVKKLGLDPNNKFKQYIEALFNVLPKVKELEERKILAEVLVTNVTSNIPKGGRITDYV